LETELKHPRRTNKQDTWNVIVPATGVKLELGFVFRVEHFELAAQNVQNCCGAQSAPHRGHKVTTTSKQNFLQTPMDAAVRNFGHCDKIILIFFGFPSHMPPEYLQTHRSMFLPVTGNRCAASTLEQSSSN
jgi:hypothetical protein